MDDKGYMKRDIIIALVVIVILSVMVFAIKDIKKTGQCVQDCTHVYNPSFADYKNRTQYPIEGFIANVCVQACKDNTYQGACSEKPGDCCNIFRQDVDTDCQDTDYCTTHADCKSGTFFYCDLIETNPTCKPRLISGNPCTENYQCLSEGCNIDLGQSSGSCN